MKRQFVILAMVLCTAVVSAQSITPETVWVRYVMDFGTPGDRPGQLSFPTGISVDPNGNVLVADTGNHRIQKFTGRGELLTHIGGFGWQRDQFQRPMDVVTRSGLNIFVSDYENQRVERYDKDLNWIHHIEPDREGEEPLQFDFPRSVAVNIHGELFVLDDEQNRVVKHDTQFKPVLSFGDYDWGDGSLIDPQQIAISRDDLVYISDAGQRCVMVFDIFGNYLYRFGAGILSRPQGVGVSDDLICVTDNETNKFYCFDRTGRFLKSMGGTGKKRGGFDTIGDCSIFRNLIYIVDTDNHRVQVFEYGFRDE